MAGIDQLFARNVVEVVARRRMPLKPGQQWHRRFICTNSFALLNSIAGKSVFHFKAPTHPPPYNATQKGLITVFDMFMQDWRNINLLDYKIVGVMPITTEEEINKFWSYFANVMSKFTAGDKKRIMNK